LVISVTPQNNARAEIIETPILVLEEVCMFAQVLQILLEKTPCKKSADIRPNQGNLLQNLSGFYLQNHSSLHKIWRRSAENICVEHYDYYERTISTYG
jgi:hypothetical protein